MIKRVFRSLRARMQGYESRHYERTRCGRELRRLKDAHKGERCVVVGNGPSLSAADLTLLHKLRVPTFGTNRVFKLFDATDWRPTYYVCEDIDILRDILDRVPGIEAEKRWIPVTFRWYEGIELPNADWFYLDYHTPYAQTCGVSLDAAHAVRCMGTVTTTCLQLAIYMGFTDIYLIGVDHNYARTVDKNGNVTIDTTVQDHFAESGPETVTAEFHVDTVTEAYERFERLSRQMPTFRVWNATR